jgi:hypothetical protein
VISEVQIMRLLEDRVPMTLLLDLLVIPDAAEIYATEGGSADWLAELNVGVA